MSVELYGYRFSVYSWIARAVLHQTGWPYQWIEVNPFGEAPPGYLAVHPFGRVPALRHGDMVIYETSAITRYADECGEGPSLQPVTPLFRAKMQQIISVADNYGYWPLVRQVFSHDVFRPSSGLTADTAELRRGLDAAPHILGSLEQLISGDPFLLPGPLTLADLHLAPILAYFALSPAGAELLSEKPKLERWLGYMQSQEAISRTRPSLPTPETGQ